MGERGYLTIARLRGAPLKVHWSLPLGALAFGGVAWAPAFWVAFVVLILGHELGHAVLVWRYGHRVESIAMSALGGACRWQGEATHDERGAVAWGGVLAQAAILAVALLAFGAAGKLESLVALQLERAFVSVNIMLIVLNLVPVAPLDGAEAWPWLVQRYRTWRQLAASRRMMLLEVSSPEIEPARRPAAKVPAPLAPSPPVVVSPSPEPKAQREPREAYQSDEAFAELLRDIADDG
jgi:Zn-dependent protease